MIIKRETLISKSIEEVWAILGHDFAHPYKWASGVNHSEGIGDPVGTMQCDERACQTVMGNIREKLTTYSDADYHLAYVVTEGMPSMVKTATNDWKLSKKAINTTHLSIKMEFIFTGIFGTLMQPLMKIKLNKIANDMIEDFAFYVENSRPHPRKLKALGK